MQLLQDSDSLPEDITGLYHRHVNRGARPNVNEILRILQFQFSRFAKIFVVIDALDECIDHSRASLPKEHRALQPKLNLMATSRHLTNIASEFHGVTTLKFQASVGDLWTYVVERMSRESRLARLIYKHILLGEDIVQTVFGNA